MRRDIYGAVRLSTEPAFAPFIEFVESLGVEIGSFDAHHASADAPTGRRLYCVPFKDAEALAMFASEFQHAIASRDDLRHVADLIGPGIGMQAGEFCFLFWPGLYGDAVTMH